jgi:DNA phosphorothioation-dependent restriction protein DptF
MEKNHLLLDELKKLKESSTESVENLDKFSEFKEYMHTPHPIQKELIGMISDRQKRSESQLILVCGNVGDGKSHTLSYIKNNYPELVSGFDFHNDATESFNPKETAVDTLNRVLEPFRDEKIDESSKKLILAINLGMLNNFINSDKYEQQYTRLKKYIEVSRILDVNAVSEYKADEHFAHVNFSEYHLYELSRGKASSAYISTILEKIIYKDERNPFYRAYINFLQSDAPYKDSCPIRINYELLGMRKVREKITEYLVKSMVKSRVILTTRTLMNFIFDILVYHELENLTLRQYTKKVNNRSDYVNYLLPNLLFNHPEKSRILKVLSEIDPVNNRIESVDEALIRFNTADKSIKIFREYIKENPTSDLIEEVVMENASRDKKEDYTKTINKTFIRLMDILPDKAVVSPDDVIYDRFVEFLYYFNKGKRKKELRDIYESVKTGIRRWNGVNKYKDYIYIQSKDTEYRFSQFINIERKKSDADARFEEPIEKFINVVILEFEGKNLRLEVDYKLYELMVKMSEGYVPTRVDKDNFTAFSKFIDRVNDEGRKNTELMIETKSGYAYKLIYDDEYEEYRFERVQ